MTTLDRLKDDLSRQVAHRLAQPLLVAGILLPVGDDDRAAFSQLTGAWTSARSLMTPEQSAAYLAETVHIADATGAPHEITRLAAYQLLLAYADAYYAAWVAAKERTLAILAATTEDGAHAAFIA